MGINQPLVSVIMPSYNHEKYISSAIESVLNQTFTDFNLIIIDDASKDGSQSIIKDYQKIDSRIILVIHDENKGIAKTFNEGIEKADGKFIAFIASDDLWVKDKLKKQLNILEENEDLRVWSEGLIIDAESNPTGKTFTKYHYALKKKKSGYIFEELLDGNFIFGSSLIFKRENLGNIRFNETLKYLNDYQFEIDLAKKYKYFFIQEPLAMYRIHGNNTILSDKLGWQKDNRIVIDYLLQKYNNDLSNKKRNKLLTTIGSSCLQLGDKKRARQYIYNAIKCYPFTIKNLYYLLVALTDENGVFPRFLRYTYHKYEGIKNVQVLRSIIKLP